jgi:hypothetical protein
VKRNTRARWLLLQEIHFTQDNKHLVPKQFILNKESTGQVTLFLVKAIALELGRRISKASCPFIWNYIQALQVVGYPPF